MGTLRRRLEALRRRASRKPTQYVVYVQPGETEEEAISRADGPLTRFVIVCPEPAADEAEWEVEYGYSELP